MSDNNQNARKITIETIERATVETIETIERVTIEVVSLTAETMTELVHVVADSIPSRQPYDMENIDGDLLEDIEIYVDAPAKQQWKDLFQMHDSDEENFVIEESESSVSTPDELSDDIVINAQPNKDEVEKPNRSTKEPNDAKPKRRQIQFSPVEISIRADALQAAQAHAQEDMLHEVGGILLGDFHITSKGERFTRIVGIVRAKKAKQMRASLNFTPEAWADVWRLIDGDDEYGSDDTPWKMVGWYHTHPNFGIFFSGADHTVHDPHFTHPCHVALVIDPIQNAHGFFFKSKEHSPAERCNEQQQCEILDDDALIAKWQRYTKSKAKLPKVEIPSDEVNPSEEAGAEEISAEELSAEELSTEETSTEETSAEETSTEETS